MVNVSTTSIMPAQHNAYDCRSVDCHPAEAWVACEKLSSAFPIISFGDLETFDASPELKRRIVIGDAKFPGFDLVAHM
jgi:hypothetical protein